MSTNGTYNILMYSHDTYGLGHIRRTMAIARAMVQKDVNILILTGSPIAGRYNLPQGVDFVRVPGMIKQSNTVYVPHSIKVDPKQAIAIRRNIITATTKTFKPDLFIVDKVPTGLKDEVKPTLKWLRRYCPKARIVLGLRDILDNVENTREEWDRKQYIEVLRELYTEIWVYGDQTLYDPIMEYSFPEDIAAKTRFTGYIPRKRPTPRNGRKKEKLVVVTIGGGGDGYPVLDNYLTMLENNGGVTFKTLMITGPFLPDDKLDSLAQRARRLGVRFTAFVKNLEKKIAQADLVISMGGYNTLCEILSQKKVALIIPRDHPREEQLIRARVFAERGLVDYIEWDKLSPEAMRAKVDAMLDDPWPYQNAMQNFSMTGLDFMRNRLAQFRNHSED
ncbi:glycosyltransferase family protein [Salidesulfovibrio onnuriiensis]|uniref:glycosyltransferase family protein n=1 Tax=Salidesulfovibrio onnuriiensis TaxID=2583823 RepID=UPI0011CBF46A|nr:glycosyltransferase [Salidesulfovibrio onnuriiensis]